jgi:prepilin-type N-terminal cleavage/methylation domain-containing protein
MSKNKQIKHKGFTLLEILLVIGIIGILAAIVIIAINPGRSLARSRDLQRKVGITEINKGLEQYYIDNNQYPSTITSSLQSICNTGASATSSGLNCAVDTVDLSMLVPTYLPAIPVDPTGVGYKVGFNSSRRIMLVADLTETVSPLIAIGTTTYPVVAVVEDTNPNIHIGDGSVGSPYQIANWSQLNHIRDTDYMNKYYILMSSLTSTTYGYNGLGSAWIPIGSSGTPFTGNFNGNGKTISDLTINLPSTSYVGLFGYITGNISDLGLLNVNVTGSSYTGGLVGYSYGTVDDCYTTGTVAGLSYTGGLVGYDDMGGHVTNSHSAVNVTVSNSSAEYIGGLVGYHYGWTGLAGITNSYATGNVVSAGNYVGGLVGQIDNGIHDKNYFTGNVTGYSYVGGLIGVNNNSSIIINNSYATGIVTGTSTEYWGTTAGGLIGDNGGATIRYSYSAGRVNGYKGAGFKVGGFAGTGGGGINNTNYWDKQNSNQEGSIGNAAVGKATTAEMQTATPFTDWDTNIWNFVVGSYPTLKP